MTLRRLSVQRARHQGGIVLVMALVLLVMISLVATLTVRRATSSEQVSKSIRTNTIAFQAAESALRFCEDQILMNSKVQNSKKTVEPAEWPDSGAPSLWQTRSNWDLAGDKAIAIDATVVNSTDDAARKLPDEALPRCMVEKMRLRGDGSGARVEAFLITAVGFSPDYHFNTTTKTPEAGGEVWLQSTITRQQ
jgi:type IV pilus assembly protein PilX